jgi:hypothetical protein
MRSPLWVEEVELADGSLAFTPEGAPAYFYQTQNITQVLSQEEYRSVKGDDIAQ